MFIQCVLRFCLFVNFQPVSLTRPVNPLLAPGAMASTLNSVTAPPTSPSSVPLRLTMSQSSEEAQRQVDEAFAALSRPWKGCVVFSLLPHTSLVNKFGNRNVPDMNPVRFTSIDFCKYLGGLSKPTSHLYFDPSKYPPPSKDTSFDQCNAWRRLKEDLMVTAFESGSPVCCNGFNKDTPTVRRFRCACFRERAASCATSTDQYRSTSLVADHKNERKKVDHCLASVTNNFTP